MQDKLTKAVAERAKAAAATYVIWDTELPSFGLRVSKGGAKSFVLKYRVGRGRKGVQRLLRLGRFPAMSLEGARKAAKVNIGLVGGGADPVEAKREEDRRKTVAELIDLYEAEGLVVQRGVRIGQPMKPLTAKYTVARLRHHVVPTLGKIKVADLNPGHIEELAREVSKVRTRKDEKGAPHGRVIVRGGEGAARKVVRDLSAVLSFAQRRRIIAANPVATAAVRKTDGRRERFLSVEEVKRLGAALDDLGRNDQTGVDNGGRALPPINHARGLDKRGKPLPPLPRKALDITRLWALTGCRRNEIAALEWRHVDVVRGLLIFDDSKTGRSIRPLAGAAQTLLRALAEWADPDSPYVFPAERGNGYFTGTKRIWPEVVKRAGLPGVTPHTLRHTLGAAAASGGEGLLLVGAILGHANARSTAIYAHVDRDPARLAADRATRGIAEALGLSVVNANALELPIAVNDAA